MKILKNTLFTLIFGLLLGVLPLQAVIVEGEQGTLGKKTITLLSDLDLVNTVVNTQQKKDLIDSITDKNNTLIITTDLADTSGLPNILTEEETEAIKESIDKIDKNNFLFGLTQLCKDNEIPVYNAEFRHAQIASAQGTLPALKSVEVTEAITDEIDRYNDDEIYMQYYRDINKVVSFISRTLKEKLEQSSTSIKELFVRSNTQEYLDIIRATETELHNIHSDYPILLGKFAKSQLQQAIQARNRNNQLTQPQKEALQAIETVIRQYIGQEYHDDLIVPRILHRIYTATEKNIIVCTDEQDIHILGTILDQLGYKRTRHEFSTLRESTSITAKLLSVLGHTQFSQKDSNHTYTAKPFSIKDFFKPRMPFWLKAGIGIAGTAIAYTLYKRFFKS